VTLDEETLREVLRFHSFLLREQSDAAGAHIRSLDRGVFWQGGP